MRPPPLSGDTGPSAIAHALQWLGSLLAGEIATSLAILAIAGLGFTMLTGRLPVRRGMTVVVGCFILFGAPSIASALRSAAETAGGAAGPQTGISLSLPEVPAQQLHPVEDPYAGASIVPRRPR